MSKVVQFEAASHTYRDTDGTIIPSVTQILQNAGFYGYHGVPQDRLERKRRLGERVDLASQFLIDNDLDWDTVLPSDKPFLKAFELFLVEQQFVVEKSKVQHRMIANYEGMRYGATLDFVGVGAMCEGRCVLDMKCAWDTQVSWGPQLAGYALGLTGEEKCEDLERFALQLLKDGTYRLHHYTNREDYATFVSALIIEHYKSKHSPRGSGKAIRIGMAGTGPVKVFQPAMESA